MILAGVISHVMMNTPYTLRYSDTEVHQNLTLHSAAQYSLFTGRFINGYCIRNYILSNYSFLYRSYTRWYLLSCLAGRNRKGEVKNFVRTRYVFHGSVCSFRFRGRRAHLHRVEPKLCRITVAAIFFESFVRISTTRMKWADGTSSWLITGPCLMYASANVVQQISVYTCT